MIRLSSVVFGCFVAVVASTTGCKVSAETKDRVHSDDNAITDTQEWNGEPIIVKIQSPGLSSNGGVNVTSDPATKTINANARIVAYAFPEHKPDAELTIADVKQTFKITHDGGNINILCDHGQAHGDSDSGSSGCELVNIKVPPGTETLPLALTVENGNDQITLQLSNAYLKSLNAVSNGAGGDINADLPSTPGGSVLLISKKGDNVTANFPTTFAADRIEIVADADKRHVPADITLDNVGVGTRGTAGTGLASIKLSSLPFAGGSGEVTLQTR